jgi:hypothetical protein
MTALTLAPVDHVGAASVWQLATIEGRRSLRRVSIWMGLALTVLIISGPTTADWPGGSYTEKLPQSFMPIVLGTFIAAFRIGRRDGHHDVSESAPLGPDNRALARLGGLALPVLLTILVTVGFAIVSRIEGGFWLGDHPRRTDTALHPISELLQPALIVAFVGALGISIGRAKARRSIALVMIAGAVLFTTFPGYWLWNIPPVHVITPVQTQPLNIELDPATDIDQLPADWYVERSEVGATTRQLDHTPTRQLVHQPTILGHDLYLVGLTALAAGLAVRHTRGRRIALSGATLAVAGVATQLIVSPL